MDQEAWESEIRRMQRSASPWQRIVRKTMLPWLGFCLACTHSQGSNRGSADAADVRPDDAPAPGDTSANKAVDEREALSPDGASTSASEVSDSRPDARQIIDGQCGDNPSDLMQVLATSLGSLFCSRTASNQPEGYINFDSEGRVTSITGSRVPPDKAAWVDSLAAYRWPCLAGQTIAYGCS
jgi:hypothetical protein